MKLVNIYVAREDNKPVFSLIPIPNVMHQFQAIDPLYRPIPLNCNLVAFTLEGDKGKLVWMANIFTPIYSGVYFITSAEKLKNIARLADLPIVVENGAPAF
jgi:hypothetical protein